MFPIVAMWSHPRSMSTTIERVMRERGDLDCLHEPFMYDYYVARRKRAMPLFEKDEDHPVTYTEVRDMILTRAEKRPVFFKDMSYHVVPHIFEDTAFCRRMRHCFLIRNPMASILSYHKLDPAVTNDEIGLQAQWQHFQMLWKCLGLAPVVVEAEAVRADPRGTLRQLWQALSLTYLPHAFTWSSERMPQDWQQVSGWHKDVASSQEIRPAHAEETATLPARFAERAGHYPVLRDYLTHHKPYYDRLRKQALGRTTPED